MKLASISLSLVDPHPANPRKSLGDLTELVASIQEIGVRTPIVVRHHPLVDGRYQLEAGHRRAAAARQAGLTEIPAHIIENDDDETAYLALVAENRVRLPLTPEEDAIGMQGVLALGDLGRAARATGADATLLVKAARVRPKLTNPKAPQATLDELATLADFEGTEQFAALENVLGTPSFGWKAQSAKREREDAAKRAESLAEAAALGAIETQRDYNLTISLADLLDDEGNAPEPAMVGDGLMYSIREWETHVTYFVTRELAAERGWISRYQQRHETPEEIAKREAKEKARAEWERGRKASEELRHAFLILQLDQAMAATGTKSVWKAVARIVADGELSIDGGDTATADPKHHPLAYLHEAMLLAADRYEFDTAVRYIGAMGDVDDAKGVIEWLDALMGAGYTLTPWEQERLDEAIALKAKATESEQADRDEEADE